MIQIVLRWLDFSSENNEGEKFKFSFPLLSSLTPSFLFLSHLALWPHKNQASKQASESRTATAQQLW